MKFKIDDLARVNLANKREAQHGLWVYQGHEVTVAGVPSKPHWWTGEQWYQVRAKDGKLFFAAESVLEPIIKDYIPPMVREWLEPQDHIPKEVKDVVKTKIPETA